MENWTYEVYWNVVLGDSRTAEDVVRDFDLYPTDSFGLDVWLGEAELAAWQACGTHTAMPDNWVDFHTKAWKALCEVEVSDE